MKETGSRFWVGIVLLSAAVLFVGCDNVTDNGTPSGSFALVSGSGTITARLLNANTAHSGKTFSFGTTSTGVPIGNDVQITSNDVSKTLESGASIVFTGGYPIVVGGFIDVDGDGGTTHMPDDGDYLASKTVTISGNTTITFNYPGDFTLVSGSGTLTARLLNAYTNHPDKTFSFGTTSTGIPVGNDVTITSNDVSKTLDSGASIVFTGGYSIVVGGFIDVDGDGGTTHMPDDGDYLASKTVPISGNTTVTFNYPGDFTEVSGSGTITINLLNANTDHGGETFSYGTLSAGMPVGSDAIIDSNNMALPIQSGGQNVVFPGGSQITVGGYIDVDGDGGTTHMPDDGDYLASQTVTVAGNTVVVFTY